MKALLRTSLLLAAIYFLAPTATPQTFPPAEQPTDDKLAERAVTLFTTLLDSESGAKQLVGDVRAYKSRSPWTLLTDLALAHKMVSDGFKPQEVVTTLEACGDAAAALDGDDETFARLTLTVAALKLENRAYPHLSDIQEMGIPIFKLLSEAWGMTPEKTTKMVQDRFFDSAFAYRSTLQVFERKYGGRAMKLCERNRQ